MKNSAPAFLFLCAFTCLVVTCLVVTSPQMALGQTANETPPETSPEPPAESSLAPLVVTSELERSGLPMGFEPGSFIRKNQDDVKSQISRSLRDVTSDTPGVSFLGGPRTRAQLPQIRGLGSDRVLVLEDGARQSFQSGHSGRIFSDAGSFEEIEIVKGPLSSMFGSGAIGGVINLRRPTARDLRRRSGRSKGGEIAIDSSTVDAGFGGRFTLFGVFPEATESQVTFEPIVSYSESKSQDLRFGNGRKLAYSAHQTKELYAGLGAKLGSWDTDLKVTNYEDNGQAPFNSSEETSVQSMIADTRNLKTDAVLSLTKKSTDWSFKAKPFVRQSRVERVRLTDSRRDLLSVETVGIDAHVDFQTSLATRGRSVIGIEGFRDLNRGERAGTTYGLFPNGETLQTGAYIQVPIDLASDVSLVSGLRADQYKSTPSDASLRGNEGSALSPKLYLVWDLSTEQNSEQNVFFGWGRGFNAPRLQDLYVSGLHFPGQGPQVPNNFFQANPDLKPETADSFETGFRGRTTSWTYNLTGFLTEAQDFIQRDVNLSAGTTRLANIDRASLYGGELLLKKTFGPWSMTATLSTVRGVNRRTSEPLPDTQADRARIVAEVAVNDLWILSSDVEITLGQERVPNGTTATGGYTIYNLGSNYMLSDNETLTVRITNLFDRAYRRHGSQIDDAGTDIRLAVVGRF